MRESSHPVPSYLQAPASQAVARDQTLLEEHANVLNVQRDKLCNALERLDGITTRLLGSAPPKPTEASPPINDRPVIEFVGRLGREFTPVIEAIHEQINRLERL